MFFLLYFYFPLQRLHHFFISKFFKNSKIKIFCIGSPKTGTTSIHKALKILGYKSVRFLDIPTYYKKGWNIYLKKVINSNYDAFVDWPFSKNDYYKQINELIPNSKYILTIRDKKAHMKSWINFYKNSPVADRMISNMSLRMEKIEKRNKEIIRYFKEDKSKLLVMNLAEGDGWEKLCIFLEKNVPNHPFPHKNKGIYINKYYLF